MEAHVIAFVNLLTFWQMELWGTKEISVGIFFLPFCFLPLHHRYIITAPVFLGAVFITMLK